MNILKKLEKIHRTKNLSKAEKKLKFESDSFGIFYGIILEDSNKSENIIEKQFLFRKKMNY